jgi:hypothetical protein
MYYYQTYKDIKFSFASDYGRGYWTEHLISSPKLVFLRTLYRIGANVALPNKNKQNNQFNNRTTFSSVVNG